MPIIFVSLDKEFVTRMKELYPQFPTHLMRVQDYKPDKKTYYVSPANSMGFMDGGIDLPLSRTVMPGIEPKLKIKIRRHGKTNLMGRKYIPIGGSVIVDHNSRQSLISAPTMLLPQDVRDTQNAYYATMAILYNVLVNRKENINKIDIVFTSLCCGCGKMSIDESIRQTIKGFQDYNRYRPTTILPDIILHEPNLDEQPKLYQNTEWKHTPPMNIQQISGKVKVNKRQ